MVFVSVLSDVIDTSGTAITVSLSASPKISGDASLPTHESVSCSDVYLIKLHLVPDVARPLVLDIKQEEHKEITF